MPSVTSLGNELTKVTMFKDNSIQLIINLGEVSDADFQKLYQIKRNGEFRILIGNIGNDWFEGLKQEVERLDEETYQNLS